MGSARLVDVRTVISVLSVGPPGRHGREPRVRQLRLHLHAALEARRHGTLSVQRLRPLQQNERTEPAIN